MESFIRLYDSTPAFVLKSKDIEDQYKELGLPVGFSLTKREIDETIIQKVFQPLAYYGGDGLSWYRLMEIKKAFIYRQVLEHTDVFEPFILALEELNHLGGHNRKEKYPPLTEVALWTAALSYLKCYMQRNPPQTEYVNDFRKKELDRGWAVNRLRKHGVLVRWEEDELKFDNLFMATSEVSELIRQIGGVRFVEKLLSMVNFNTKTGRLEMPKRGNNPMIGSVNPDIPFAYLINLGLRHTSSKGSDAKLETNFGRVFQLATDLCTAVYPVMSYTIWEDIMHKGESPIAYFKRLTLVDTIYYVQQCSVQFAVELYGFLIDELISNGYELPIVGFDLHVYKAVMQEMTSRTSNKTFVRIKEVDIKAISDSAKRRNFLKIVGMEMGTVNPTFEEPLEYNKVNYSDSPFILIPNGDIMLYPAAIGVSGWYEKLMTLLREKYQDTKTKIDNVVGLMLEDYVKHKLATKGMASKYGKYEKDGVKGECNIIVEGNERILLMELKKKNLTRIARQGNEYQIVLDFAGSLFNSQEQCFRTQMLLMKYGQIELNEKEHHDVLEQKDRPNENITLTLNDYGSLQECYLIEQVMQEFMRYRFTVNEEEVDATELKDDIKKSVKQGYVSLAKKQDALDGFLNEIYKMELAKLTIKQKNYKFRPFFNSWFLNIEQLCYMINISSDANDLAEKLNSIKSMVYGTKDFWTELPMKLEMVEKTKELNN
jgi:hypothetical protein